MYTRFQHSNSLLSQYIIKNIFVTLELRLNGMFEPRNQLNKIHFTPTIIVNINDCFCSHMIVQLADSFCNDTL